VDFGGAQAFAPATALITVGGVVGGETVSYNMDYQVGASCTSALLYSAQNVGASFTGSGIPGAQQRADDFHAIVITALTATNAFRSITESFHTLAARTVTPGAALPVPTVTSLSATYQRLQAVYTLPADYNGATTFAYDDGSGKSVSITARFGYLGGTATTLALADYSGLAGWNNSWAPGAGIPSDWSVSAFGGNAVGSACTENASLKSAVVSGTF
jgi:hypothetical protein